MGDISRRNFIKQAGSGIATILLPNVVTAFAPKYDSLDYLTEKMLEELGSLRGEDIKLNKLKYYDNASVSNSADIPNYNIYYFIWADESETLFLDGKEKWYFYGKKSSEGIIKLNIFGYTWGTKNLDPKIAVPVFTRIRDLLDIDIHSQNSKGKDLTSLVDDLSRKVLSIEKFKVEYDDSFNIKASFEKGDFKITYKFDKNQNVDFTIIDGKNKLDFQGRYNKDGGIDSIDLSVNTTNLGVNSSDFCLSSGKLEKFPRKVYNETSAMGIIENAKSIEKYLTSTIKNMKLENYTDLFKRLVSTKVDTITVDDDYLEGSIIIKAGERKIRYVTWIYHDKIYVSSGNNEVDIITNKDTGKIEKVIINKHPFIVDKEKINFIRSTYTQEQATSIIEEAQKLYDAVSGMAKGRYFLSRYIGQPLVRNA